MIELKPCKYCGRKPQLYPLVVKTVLKEASKKHKGNIYKIKAERIEIPALYTVSCNSEKCKSAGMTKKQLSWIMICLPIWIMIIHL